MKRILALICSLILLIALFPSILIASAATEDAVGKNGYRFYYNALTYNDIVDKAGDIIFKGEYDGYEYTGSIVKISSNQCDFNIEKFVHKNGAYLQYGNIVASYFSNGDSAMVKEEFDLTEVCISIVYDYDVFRTAFSIDASSVAYPNAFDQTNALIDLQSAGVDLLDYPFDITGKIKGPELINFVEYGYSSNPDKQNDFALYIYFYNPQNVKIDEESLSNRIQMASEYDAYPVTKNTAPTGYDTYSLKFCSKSEGDNEGLFYKFRVLDHRSKDGKTIQERVNASERRYDVSGIVLYDKTGRATEYKLGGTYRFAGYAKGFGAEGAESTLVNKEYTALETISLEVTDTTYRTGQSELGVGHQNQISSVYFSVPNRFITDKYGNMTGNLQKIRAEWWEYKTKPMMIFTEQLRYDDVEPYLGVDIGYHTDGIEQKYWIDKEESSITGGPAKYLGYTYNVADSALLKVTQPLKQLYVAFVSSDGKVNSATIRDKLLKYNKSHNNGYLPIKNGEVSADIFESTVDEGRTFGYNVKDFDANDKYNLLLDKSSPFLAYWGINNITTMQLSPIHKLTTDDLNKSDANFADSCYVLKEDAGDIKSKALNAKSKEETPYLFRFATTDYYNQIMYSCKNGAVIDLLKQESWITQETVFFDFKMIHLTFEVDGSYKTIPVVQDPTDIIAGITPQPQKQTVASWWQNIVSTLGVYGMLAIGIIGGLVLFGVELKLTGICFSKNRNVITIIIGIILIAGFVALDYFFATWVVNIITGLGGFV